MFRGQTNPVLRRERTSRQKYCIFMEVLSLDEKYCFRKFKDYSTRVSSTAESTIDENPLDEFLYLQSDQILSGWQPMK